MMSLFTFPQHTNDNYEQDQFISFGKQSYTSHDNPESSNESQDPVQDDR
jgi:hypothetical protein